MADVRLRLDPIDMGELFMLPPEEFLSSNVPPERVERARGGGPTPILAQRPEWQRRETASNIAHALGDLFIPQSPIDVALMGLGGTGRLARVAGTAGLALMDSPAEGHILSRRAVENLPGRVSRPILKDLDSTADIFDAIADPTVGQMGRQVEQVLGQEWPARRWFRSPGDGDWRFAANPTEASPKSLFSLMERSWPSKDKTFALGDVWDSPILFGAYPEFQNVPVNFRDRGSLAPLGSYDPKAREINVNRAYSLSTGYPQARVSGDVRRLMGEEIQHLIQNREDWPVGTSPSDIWPRFPQHQERYLSKADEFIQGLTGNYAQLPVAQHLMYRASPGEWEAGLAGNRLQQRVSAPRHFDWLMDPDFYYKLNDPRLGLSGPPW